MIHCKLFLCQNFINLLVWDREKLRGDGRKEEREKRQLLQLFLPARGDWGLGPRSFDMVNCAHNQLRHRLSHFIIFEVEKSFLYQ